MISFQLYVQRDSGGLCLAVLRPRRFAKLTGSDSPPNIRLSVKFDSAR